MRVAVFMCVVGIVCHLSLAPGARAAESVGPDEIGQVESLATLGDVLFAGTRDALPGIASERCVWRIPDTTAPACVLSKTRDSLGNPRTLTVFGGVLYLLGSKSGGAGSTIWRSTDGIVWTETLVIPNDPTDDNRDIPAAAVFGGFLYAGTRNDGTTGGEVWRSSDGITWNQVGPDGLGDSDNERIGELVVFGDQLYAGTFNPIRGAHLYRTQDGVTWSVVVGDAPGTLHKGGFGSGANDPQNTSIFASAVFGGRLYVGIKHQGGATGPAEVWRSADGTSWSQVGRDGFGDLANEGIDAMAVHGPRLFAGTINPANGAELWATLDGASWKQVAAGGLGNPTGNTRVRAMTSDGTFLFLGLGNGRKSNDDSHGQILATAAVPALRPVALLLAALLTAAGAAFLRRRSGRASA